MGRLSAPRPIMICSLAARIQYAPMFRGALNRTVTPWRSRLVSTVSDATLKALSQIDSPSICNAIEGFNVRPKNAGFMLPEIKTVFQEFPPIVGYAVTGVISANRPEGHSVAREDWWDLIVSVPEPRFIVLHDIDNPPLGAYWGEVQSNIHKALGALAVATDGTVRDLDEVRAWGSSSSPRRFRCPTLTFTWWTWAFRWRWAA